MKRIAFILIITTLISLSFAIQVSGNQSGIWSPVNNPYEVIGAITVPASDSLIIQAGVEIHLLGSYQITVEGILNAYGTEVDSIRILNMQANPTTLWPGLRFEDLQHTSHLNYVYLEYATYGVRTINSPIAISHCHINLCEKGMEFYGIGSAVPLPNVVEYCLIENCTQNAILVTSNSNAYIRYNEIRYNGTGAQFRAAIQMGNQSGVNQCNPNILYNHIHHNYKQGISAWDIASSGSINPQILHNIIEYNYTGIYLLQASGYVADNQINYNFIPGDMNSGAGVMVSGVTSVPYFERNHIEGNYTGFYITNNGKPVLGDLTLNHIWAQGENTIINNIDVNNHNNSVYCDAYPNANFIIMAENNNWGFATEAEIAQTINDHNDNAALPTVDFEPFIIPLQNTTITGSYIYTGTAQIASARLELITFVDRYIYVTIPLSQLSYSFETDINTVFYAQVVLTEAGTGKELYGCAGGYLNPTVFSPHSGYIVNIGIIEVTDSPLARYEYVGEPMQENSVTEYPILTGKGLYGYDKLDWVYAEGDYLYLRRNFWRTPTGEVVTELPWGIVYRKYLHINAGDSWQETEVGYPGNIIVTTEVQVNNCVTEYGAPPYLLFTRKDFAGNVVDKRMKGLEETLFHYQNHYTIATDNIIHIPDNNDPLTEGNVTFFIPEPLNEIPSFLAFNPDIDIHIHIQLFWQAPAQGNYSWTHYRIYENGVFLDEMPFSHSDYIVTNFNPQITTYFYVTATDGINESEPSNYVTVIYVGNEDPIQKPVSVAVYPNPVSFISGSVLKVEVKNAENSSSIVEVYNLKGQLVLRKKLQEEKTFLWNGIDNKGKRSSSGIYFLKIKVKGEKPVTRKIVVL
ncbi:MAG TPA: T9SS type A sorting domain-containing protein [Candidatus Cloacimonas sp.]|nr:T9SS type A sorting domain-containing protein [Candidatus Cloacimonas sp.]